VSGFLGIGQNKPEKQAYGELGNVFNFALPLAQSTSSAGAGTTKAGLSTVGAGLNTLSGPLAYFQKLMSGNRPAMEQAVAPEANAARASSDAAARNQAAMGTARGGGTAGGNQQRHTDVMAQIDNLLFGARPAAAKATTDIGTTQSQIGLGESQVGNQQLMEALQSLGLGTSAAGTTGQMGLGQSSQLSDMFKVLV
jgi:hypothetical protein